MRLIIWLFVATLFAASAAAQEQTPNPENDAVARRAFEAGRQAFSAGDYETALRRFRESYELSHRGELLYNIAQTLDRLRRDEETLETLRLYLAEVPNTRSRAEVEARISVLERALERERAEEQRLREEREARDAAERARREREEADRRAQTQQTTVSRPPLHPALFIAAAVLAVGGGAVAVWTGLETLSLHDQYEASNNLDEAQGLYDDGMTYQTVTNVLIFSSAAIAATAIVMAIFTDWGGGPPAESEQAATTWMPTLELSTSGAIAGAAGAF